MKLTVIRKITACLLSGTMVFALTACAGGNSTENRTIESTAAAETSEADETAAEVSSDGYSENYEALTMDNSRWSYDHDNDVYYQIGVQYCASPEDTDYETMGIYVPGAYMNATENGDGTYTCTVKPEGQSGNYTAATAPIVLPVNTPGYASSAAPTEYDYSSLSDYLSEGFIYIQPGIRGRQTTVGNMTGDSSVSADDTSSGADSDDVSGGAPWGATDMKAAIRYYRFNAETLPGDSDSIFTFGMSGGGAQSAVMGASGDSKLYFPYLEKIGAAMTDADGNSLSDSVKGSMCWCPITDLDSADAAYEWNMGQFTSDGVRAEGTFTGQLSDDLASEFADYINNAGLTDTNGNTLTLEKSDSGIYQAGSYYDYILSLINTSLNNFLSDTTFPYTAASQAQFPGGQYNNTGAGAESENAAGNMQGKLPDGISADGMQGRPAGGQGQAGMNTGTESGTTYETVQDYIDSLNSDTEWVKYDAATNTASVASIEAFAEHCKNASKDIGAFDQTDRGQGENTVFGDGSSASVHFDSVIENLLKQNETEYSSLDGWSESLISDYEADDTYKDELGTDVQTRLDMYTPLYYLLASYDGYKTSSVAQYWRIRTGIEQSDTALTTEANLALALQNYDGVSDVDFATVWGMQHTEAERTGNSTSNFTDWVNECMSGQ